MKLWAISPIVTGDVEVGTRASVDDEPETNASAVIPVAPNGGQPLYRFAFCRVGTRQFNAVKTHPNILLLPDASLDVQLGTLGDTVRSEMVQNLEAYVWNDAGFRLDAHTANVDTATYREYLQAIVDQLSPGIPVGDLDAED